MLCPGCGRQNPPDARFCGHPGAREQLANAVTMLREMDMPFWLERGEAELRSI